MERNPFENYELCDGSQCASAAQCARHMGNVDIDKARNLYVVFNVAPRIVCNFFLCRPNEGYPSGTDASDEP